MSKTSPVVTFQGQTKSLIEWSKYLDLSASNLRNRLYKLHWPIEKAFTYKILKPGDTAKQRKLEIGTKVNLLSIKSDLITKNKKFFYECLCDCGKVVLIQEQALITSRTKSCGCLRKLCAERTKKHGATAKDSSLRKEFKTWIKIKERCFCTTSKDFKSYGAKGITLEPLFQNDFLAFLAHVGPAPSKDYSIDRIDNTKGYVIGNMRWATATQQARNRSTSLLITFNNEIKSLADWCELLNLPYDLTRSRIQDSHWSVEEAFSNPAPNKRHQRTRAKDKNKKFIDKSKIGTNENGRSLASIYPAEYGIWYYILKRCMDPANKAYANYGGRGVSVCSEWSNSFGNFIKDMKQRPSKSYSIDRIDVNGNYEPSNCRWATLKQQARNRRKTKYVTYKDQTKSVPDWCEQLNLNRRRVLKRLNNGWEIDRALEYR